MEGFRLSSFYGRSLVLILGLTVFSCSGGGGCSSCEGCGVQPIAGGFPIEDRIPNAAQVRLTSSGLDFLEDNIDGIVATFLPDGLSFPVPRTEIIFGASICTNNDCTAHIEIESVTLEPTAPNLLRAHIRANVDSRDLAGTPGAWQGSCDVELDTRGGRRSFVGLVADLVLEQTTQLARGGYTKVRVANAGIAPGEGIETEDYEITGNILCRGAAFLDDLFDFIPNQINNQIGSLLQGALDEQLCTRRGEFGCPTGTHAVPDENPDSICRFQNDADAECVPILLGMDGEGDLGGALLGGFSPGAHAYAQFLLAAGGDGQAVNQGMTIDFYGGFRGTDRTFTQTPAHHSCVPTIDPPPLPEIPQLQAFRGNVIPGTAIESHVGIGIAEAFLDYAAYGLFDSGLLCLGVGTRLSQQLSTGLVSALIGSLNALTFPEENSALSIALRPQAPPDVHLGTGVEADPLLQISLPAVEADFYVWSSERYVRFMTFKTDLSIGADLSVEDGQLVPQIHYINASNSEVTNTELLSERPTQLANVLESLISSFAGMLTSGLGPIDLPSIMGFQLEVPTGGVTRVLEGDHRFLGIFANLAIAGPSPYTAEVDTRLWLSDFQLDRASMSPETWKQGPGNSVWLHFDADGPAGAAYEFSYRIDGGPWSPWTTDRRVRVEDEILLFQARHRIEARARIAGERLTTDSTPAVAELLVDVLPPVLNVARTADGVRVEAHDVITPKDKLEVRYQIDGAWTEWGQNFELELPYDEASVVVEVRDEAGNVGRSEAALIRGLPNANVEGCGCSAPGSSSNTPFALIGLVGLFGLFIVRRRSRGSASPALFGMVLALGLVVSGCECDGPMEADCDDLCRAARPPNVTSGAICCEATNMCVDYDVDDLCDPGYTCPVSEVVVDDACGVSCAQCTAKPGLDPGMLATYLDSYVDETGKVYLSGYSPGDAHGDALYGDLVFGTWNGSQVEWTIVDGAPRMPITNDPNGWRGGVSDPGPDVGRWTSLAKAGDTFLISYYDRTNGALKFAAGEPGSWDIHTVDDTGDSGRYSSLVVTPEGVPVIAYLRIQESPETPGQIVSSVMVAMANIAIPSAPTDWTLTEVASGPMPCRAEFCSEGSTCLESGQCVMPTSDCTDGCDSGQACFNGRCIATIPANYVEDMPPAYGLYTSLAVDPTGGLALVYYDRTAGDIHGVRYDGASWGTPFLIDGYGKNDPFVGDCGMSADVAVDSSGIWHVTYVDGTEETLRYAQVQSTGSLIGSPEVVDDGSTIDGETRHADGRHIVGDDASIAVLEGGTVRIAYQDATAQNLVVAVRPAGGGDWAIAHIDTDGSTGFWVDQEVIGATSYLSTFWMAREGNRLKSGVRVLMAE